MVLLVLPLIYLAELVRRSKVMRRVTPRTRRILKWVLVILISLAMVYPVFIGLMFFLFAAQYYPVLPFFFLSQLLRPEEWLVLFGVACLLLASFIVAKRRHGKHPEDVVPEQPAVTYPQILYHS